MANGNVTITNGKGATKTIGAHAFQLISKGTGVAKIRNEDWWIDGQEKPIVEQNPRPGAKIPEKKQQPAQKPAGNFVPQELISMKETRELKEKVKELEDQIAELSAENMQLKIKLEAGQKLADSTPAIPGNESSAAAAQNAGGAALGPDGQPLKPEAKADSKPNKPKP